MKPLRIFISSVQREFAKERVALRDYLRGDALLRRFFEPFIFEDVPAADRRTDEVYLDEVAACDVYLALFGAEYGWEDPSGVSPTDREFQAASAQGKTRLVFIKDVDARDRHPKMLELIRRAEAALVRRRFLGVADLIANVYVSLIQLLEDRDLIRTGPFDAAPCLGATTADLDEEKVRRFVRAARFARAFPLSEDASIDAVMTHLNLVSGAHPSHAAILLFGRAPQRFLIASEVKCAHFHGRDVVNPIPSYQVYKGTVFEVVDAAVDFVLSKINRAVGTRANGMQVPVTYEIPPEVVREAIVNAVAHRDYTSNGSVQVMLFEDRLEVWNPGSLPASLTPEKLRKLHGSVPANPLLAEPMYLAKYIERMGTGTRDMIALCRKAGLPEPEFRQEDGFVVSIRRRTGEVTGEVAPPVTLPVTPPVAPPVTLPVAPPVEVLIKLLTTTGALRNAEILKRLGLKDRAHLRERYIEPALQAGLIEMTIPEKPTSRLQKYRLTEKAVALLQVEKDEREPR